MLVGVLMVAGEIPSFMPFYVFRARNLFRQNELALLIRLIFEI